MSSNLIKDFDDTQKFNPIGHALADNGSILTKYFTGAVSWQNLQLPSALKTVDPTAAPPDETTGNIYILHNNVVGAVHAGWDGAAKNDVVYFDGSLWQKITPVAGQTIYDKERNCLCKFNGSKWLYEECYAEIELSVSEIQNSTKVDIALPVTSLDILEPISCVDYLDFVAAAYVGSSFLALYFEHNATAVMEGKAAQIAATADRGETMFKKDTIEAIKGDKLQVYTSANVTTGDSKIKVWLKYRLING